MSRWARVVTVAATMAMAASGGLKAGARLLGGAGGQAGPVSSSAAAQWQDVIRNLRHPDAKVRLTAVQQLGAAGYAAAADYVAPLITDPDDQVQFAAIDAELSFFLVEPVETRRVMSMSGGSRSRAQEAFDAGPFIRMAASPAPVVVLDNLITAMRDSNARIRFDAVHALGVIAEAPVPPAQAKGLLDGLEHYDPVIRAATARVIGRLRVADAGDKLIAGLNDSNALVRRFCAEALGRIREERAVQSLTDLATYYRGDETSADMLLALARIAHASSLDLFRSQLRAANPATRRAAAEGLGRLRDRDSLDALKAMVTSDPSTSARLAATFAVGAMTDPQTHVIAAALASSDAAQARDYLIELGPAAVAGIQSALGVAADPRVRADLVHALGFSGARSAVPIVEPFLKDKDERVSRAATNAINRLTRT